MNRPAARNALSRALLTTLREEIDAVHSQYDSDGNEISRFSPSGMQASSDLGPTRALVIASGVNSSFCAGADLKERKTMTTEEVRAFLSTIQATFASLAALPIPSISAISSIALGGGLELALSTHMRVLTSNAVVGLPETRLGIIPGAGGTFRLPALIGTGRARDLILTGRRVSAAEAYFLGIADRLVEVLPEVMEGKDGKMDEKKVSLETARRSALSEAVRLAQEICEGAPMAVRAALKAVHEPSDRMENAMYARVVETEDKYEALKAFGEKRKPVFKGR